MSALHPRCGGGEKRKERRRGVRLRTLLSSVSRGRDLDVCFVPSLAPSPPHAQLSKWLSRRPSAHARSRHVGTGRTAVSPRGLVLTQPPLNSTRAGARRIGCHPGQGDPCADARQGTGPLQGRIRWVRPYLGRVSSASMRGGSRRDKRQIH